MATRESLEEEDEFFGTEDDCDHEAGRENECGHRELHSGLAVAESSATAVRYRNIGYHETFEASKEEKLQNGFESGYCENIDVARRIGELLGEITMKAKLKDGDDGTQGSCHLTSLQIAHDFFVRMESDDRGVDHLILLENDLKALAHKHSN